MDENRLSLFLADLGAQKVATEQVFQILEQRTANLNPDSPESLESTAYQLHNLYNAIEDLLKLVATHFENNMSDAAQWRSLLLKRMTQPVMGIRPAVLSLESYQRLNGLRGFRHFFRHAYGAEIDYSQLRSNLDKAEQLIPMLFQDLAQFIQTIRD